MHTEEASACARKSVHEMIKRYKELGFSGAVLTNHFIGGNTCCDRALPWNEFLDSYCRAYYEGKETAEKLDFDLLFGIEQGYGGGKEFLLYGLTPEFLYARPFLRQAPLATWFSEVDEAGGILAYAHPFRDRAYIKEPDAMPDMRLCHGVECFNFCNKPEENIKAFDTFKDSNTLLLAGSDLHDTNFSACFGVSLERRAKTEKDLAEILFSKEYQLYI